MFLSLIFKKSPQDSVLRRLFAPCSHREFCFRDEKTIIRARFVEAYLDFHIILAFALQWLIGTFIGLLILIGDSCFYNGAGVIAANVTLFWSYQVTDFAWPYFVYFSPVSWSTLSTYVPTCIQQIPTVWQGIALSILLNAILILLVLLVNERKNTGRILPNSLKEKLQ